MSLRDVLSLPVSEIHAALAPLIPHSGPAQFEATIAHIDAVLAALHRSAVAGNRQAVQALIDLLSSTALSTTYIGSLSAKIVVHLDALVAVFDVLVVDRRCDFDCGADLLEMLQYVAEVSVTKDALGEVLIPRIAAILPTTSDASFHFQRMLVTVLTNLTKGSKPNKIRLGTCEFIAEALTMSGDFFFQMQCIELLFRVFRFSKTVLPECAALPQSLRIGIELLPNHTSLVDKIIELLSNWSVENIDKNTGHRRLIGFPILGAQIGGRSLCDATTVHFSKRFFVMLLPSAAGHNATIVYESVREVRFTRTCEAVVKLATLPNNLREFVKDNPPVNGADGNAFVMQLSPQVLEELKKTPIRGWIADALDRAKAALVKVDGSSNTKRVREAAPAITTAPTPTVTPVARAPREADAVNSGSSTSSGGPVERDANLAEKRPRKEQLVTAAPPPPPSATAMSSNNENAPFVNYALHPFSHPIGASVSGSTAVDDVLSHLKSVVADRVEARRRANAEHLNATTARILSEMDETRLRNSQERDQFKVFVRTTILDLEAADMQLKEQITLRVTELNQELHEVQAIRLAITERLERLQESLAESMSDARKIEAEHLRALKQRVDEQMSAMETKMMEIVSAANPVRFLTAYIARKMEEEELC